MNDRIALGISTCPNDTFAFHALLAGESDPHGFQFDVELLDVQELNERLYAGRFDAAKASFHAALGLAKSVVVLPAGSALGFGVGPLVLARPGWKAGEGSPPRVLCPGAWTTATLLWKLFHPEPVHLEQRVFSGIMPALQAGEADLGVCIHEGRFTWRESGLRCLEDLGETWETHTKAALPLGGIVARRRLGPARLDRLSRAIRDSLRWGLAHRDACLPTMRRYAQELSDEVLMHHVELYVNEETLEWGDVGDAGLRALFTQGQAAGLLPLDTPALEVHRPRESRRPNENRDRR